MSIVKRFTFSLLLLVGLVLAPLSARAASVSPVWTNDTVADTLSFQDTFGHNVQLGTYSPATGVWTAGVGTGAVTLLTWTGGLVSIANPTTTPAFTIAGTSGGIPYFSSGTTWASSAALASGGLVVGGGAGAAPASIVLGGDCTLASPNITCTKTGGTTFTLAAAAVPLSIANGGTGQTTANPAFNALSPMTTAGDIIYGGAAGAGTRLAPGTSSQFLTGGSPPSWLTMAGDCTFANPNITCLKTSGTPFGTFATQNFAAPPTIGGTTPAPGNFTALSATSFSIATLSVGAAGMVGDGVTDNATAFQTDLTAVASGGYIHLPCGIFKLTASAPTVTLASGKHLTLEGGGHGCTRIFYSTTGSQAGIVITETDLGSSVTIRGIEFTTDQATVNSVGITVQNLNQNNVPNAIQNNFEDLVFRGNDWSGGGATDYFSNTIDIANVNWVNFENIQIYGTSAANLGTGVLLSGKTGAPTGPAVVANFVNFSVSQMNIGLYYNSYYQGVAVANSNFTGNQYGIYVAAGEGGVLDQLSVVNSQFANYKGGITELAFLQDTQVVGSYFNIPTGTGIHGIDLYSARSSISGNSFYGAAQPTSVGVSVNAACVACAITGNSFGNWATGISIASGATGVATGNNFNSNTVNFGGTFTSTFAVYNNNSDAGFVNTSPAGVTNASVAAAGRIGEVISLAFTAPAAAVTGVIKNIGSVSLTAGNWMCSGMVETTPAGTTTTQSLYGTISTANNTIGANGLATMINSGAAAASLNQTQSVGPVVLYLSATTTYYLNADVFFSVSTMQVEGMMQCVRFM